MKTYPGISSFWQHTKDVSVQRFIILVQRGPNHQGGNPIEHWSVGRDSKTMLNISIIKTEKLTPGLSNWSVETGYPGWKELQRVLATNPQAIFLSATFRT